MPGTRDTAPTQFPLRLDLEDVRVSGLTGSIVAATAGAALTQTIHAGTAGADAVKSAAQAGAEEGRKILDGSSPRDPDDR